MKRLHTPQPTLTFISSTLLLMTAAVHGQAEPVVPGSGTREVHVGGDFENPAWLYVTNAPKSSQDLNGAQNAPLGHSLDLRWEEGYRGQPDIVERVATPAGGLPGSTGALRLRTRDSGIPGSPSHSVQQEDFLPTTSGLEGGYVPADCKPNFVVRLYFRPFSQWEQRNGSTFAIRAQLRRQDDPSSAYWPGMTVVFYPPGQRPYLFIRANDSGSDYQHAINLGTPGWWTFGMSVSTNGQLHYYASPGVDALTSADRIASHYPYGLKCGRFEKCYFNVHSPDDGTTWSTDWVVDDALLYSADTDADEMPDRWEQWHFGSLTNAAAGTDADGDGASDRNEYRAATNPTNSASVLRIDALQVQTNGSRVIHWQSVPGKIYSVRVATNDWAWDAFVVSNMPAGTSPAACTDTATRASHVFYRVTLDE